MDLAEKVTLALRDSSPANKETIDQLFPIVYDELRKIARLKLNRVREDHTLDSIALVNEVYQKLVLQDSASWENKSHFLAICARAMHTLLIDYARFRKRERRGAGAIHLSLEEEFFTPRERDIDELLDLSDALERLGRLNNEAMQLIECRFFAGLTLQEAALAVGLPYGTARRRWEYAKLKLHDLLEEE